MYKKIKDSLRGRAAHGSVKAKHNARGSACKDLVRQ